MKNGNKLRLAQMIICGIIILSIVFCIVFVATKNENIDYGLLGIALTLSAILGGTKYYQWKKANDNGKSS